MQFSNVEFRSDPRIQNNIINPSRFKENVDLLLNLKNELIFVNSYNENFDRLNTLSKTCKLKCYFCNVTKTPQWRIVKSEPPIRKIACNSCGLRMNKNY